MITRAVDAGTPAAWVTADEVYGQDPALRAELARRGLGYVLAIAKRHLITTAIGARPAIELARRLPARAWQRMSAGPGAKGPRWYDWALIEATDPAVTEGDGPHWLLIRRSISDGEYAFYRATPPGPVPLARLVKVAGAAVEDRGRPPLVPVRLRCFFMGVFLVPGLVRVEGVPSGRGCSSRAGVPCVHVAGASARLRR